MEHKFIFFRTGTALALFVLWFLLLPPLLFALVALFDARWWFEPLLFLLALLCAWLIFRVDARRKR